MWPIETEDKFCENSKIRNDVQNQLECQSICLDETTCVGIAYTPEIPTYCYLCANDELTDTFQFSFYRRGTIFLHSDIEAYSKQIRC